MNLTFEHLKRYLGQVFNDTSISTEDCIAGLQDLREEIDTMLDSLGASQ